MSNKQQPPLPTLQPGDSHMESLIEAAIQGHADTQDAMRWLVRQLVPATQPAEVTRDEVMQAAKEATAPEWQDVVDGWHMGLDLMAFARAILALHPQASPDGRGTDAQILKEREIARHAIDGAIAAGYAGATHPGADHWLAAAHNAGMRIAELERAMTPVPCNTFLVRDVAELLGCSVPDVCTAFVQLGRGNRSTNMAITPDEALSVARHLALRPAQVPMTPLTDAQMEKGRDQIFSINNPYCPCDRKTFKKVAQWVERHHQIGITAQAKKEGA